jgi:hypothetical protein
MKDKQKSIFTVKVTYKADITLTIEAENADDALRQASEKAQTADNSEFNIYDEEDITIVGCWMPEDQKEPVPEPVVIPLEGIDGDGGL